MANLPESVIYPTGVFQLELDTPVIGGTPAFDGGGAPISGFSNAQAKQLADRTSFLKAGLELVPTQINDAITDLKDEIDPLPQYLLDSLLDSPSGVCPLDAGGLVPLANLPPISGGDVEGPVSSADGDIALFDGTTGKLLKTGGQLSDYERLLTAGMNVTIDRTDPDNPIVNASITGGGGGDVVGPASSVNNSVALFDGTTGKLLKEGGVLGTAASKDISFFATTARVDVVEANAQSTTDRAIQVVGEYTNGLVLKNRNQGFRYLEDIYLPTASTVLPYTTTGSGAGEIATFRSVGDALLRSDLAASTGASKVGYARSAPVANPSTVQAILSTNKISIWEFASAVVSKPIPSDPNSWDWTPAFQAASDSLVQFELPTNGDLYISIPKGRFKVGSFTLGYRKNLIFEGGTLAPLDTTTARTHMIKLTGRNRIYNPVIDADYATNYETIFWCRGRYIDIIAPEIWKAKCAYVFGDPAWETDAASGHLGDSEISINGGSTNWCITCARAYGLNTIVQFVGGHQAYSYKFTLPAWDPRKAAWEALIENTFINVGAVIYLTGCFTGNFSPAYNLVSRIQPTNQPDYLNSYGRYILTGTHIETGRHLQAEPAGAVTIQDPKNNMLTMTGCSGYMSASAGPLIDTQNSLQGIYIVASKFYGAVQNNICTSFSANIHIDPDCFVINTVDFYQTLAVRYPVGVIGFNALNSSGTTQTFTQPASTIKMPSVINSDVHSTYQSLWYSSATGVFTAQTLMRDVTVSVGLTLNGALSTDVTEFILYVSGVGYAISDVLGIAPAVVFKIPKLLRGETLEVRAGSSPGRACFGGPANYMRVSAAITGGAAQ